jgi:hypothetical protein
MSKKYQRLVDRRKKCINLYKKTYEDKYLREDDSIVHFLGAGGIEHYEFIVDFCNKNNFTCVYDIGAAYGHQSEVFFKNDKHIEYIGIDDGIQGEFWNNEKYTYFENEYPCKLNPKDSDLAVSVLCLGWNCYLYEGNKTLNEQFKALSNDFKQALIYAPRKILPTVKKYFKEIEVISNSRIDTSFIYMKN